MTEWSIKHDTLIDNQYGFQKVKPTMDCIFILHSLIYKSFKDRKKLYVALFDWEKMFDRIVRCCLCQKIISENVSSKVTIVIKNQCIALSKRVSVIKALHPTSLTKKIGVKQGDPSSSLLSLFFLNEIIKHIFMRRITISDQAVLAFEISSPAQVRGMVLCR